MNSSHTTAPTGSNKNITPFLKWAGGKRWLVGQIDTRPPTGRYIEPFVGGAAVFFHMRPSQALLSDVNQDLIDVYRSVRDHPQEIQDLLQWHQIKHSKEHFYKVRSSKKTSQIERAAQFIYLNRTCWNGLYRVNKMGVFNVPIGTKNTVLLDSDRWDQVSLILKSADIQSCDFEVSIAKARHGDLIFADPPYTVKHNFNGFIKYNESIFTWEDQIRLRDSLVSAAERGARIITTNAAHQSIRELYKNNFEISTVSRASVLAGKSSARGVYEEFLIKANYAER